MAFASGSQARLAYVPETTFNVTPASPQLTELPKQSYTLGITKELITDPTITSDRLQAEDRHGNLTVGGDLVVTLRHGVYDSLLEAAVQGTWTSNVLKNGTLGQSIVPRSFTFEKGFTDVGKYEQYTGVRINTFNLEINPGSICTATFGTLGAGAALSATPLDATVPAATGSSNRAMSHVGGTISVGGTSAICTACTINIDNGMSSAWAIGSNTAKDVVSAESIVTGSATFYIESDLTKFNYFLNETTTTMSVQVTDGTNSYTILIPAVKFNSADTPVSGSGLLFMTVNWKASKDATTGASIQITRTPIV